MSRNHDSIVVWVGFLQALFAMSCEYDFQGPNLPPVAQAGPDKEIEVSQSVVLNGEHSYDPEGGKLTFSWRMLSLPANSQTTISSEKTSARFIADQQGVYLISLVVFDDQQVPSPNDIVQIRATRKECASVSDCDDKQACTKDTCVLGYCKHVLLADGSDCDDQLFCTVSDTCFQGICAGTERSCEEMSDVCNQGVCNESEDACQKKPVADHTPCQDAFCTVKKTCLAGQCQGGQPRDCQAEVGQECLQTYCNEDNQQCDTKPNAKGTPCLGTDNEPCNSTCNGAGLCEEGVNAENLQHCQDEAGICCNSVCHVGYHCCSDSDCDDSNVCTTDSCAQGNCQRQCTDDDCFFLEMDPILQTGADNPVKIHTCYDDMAIDRFVCQSNRNHQDSFEDYFEQNLDSYSISGHVIRNTSAQNPYSKGSYGVRLCGHGSSLTYSVSGEGIDSADQVEISFWAANHNLRNNSLLHLEYHDGFNWWTLLLLGDNQIQPFLPYHVLIPKDGVNNTTIKIRFIIDGGINNGTAINCAYLDDLKIWRYLPIEDKQTLLHTDLDNGDMEPFRKLDPEGNDVHERNNFLGAQWLAIQDNVNAGILSDQLDTSTINLSDQIMLRFAWNRIKTLGKGEYCQAEYSLDGGTSFQLVSAIGDGRGFDLSRYSRIRLPCRAHGRKKLLLRFICPATSDTQNSDGINIDDISLFVQRPAWKDHFSTVTNEGQGVYSTTLYSTTTGTASAVCSYDCLAQTNRVEFTID